MTGAGIGPILPLMQRRRLPRSKGRHAPPRGVRLERKKRFGAELPTKSGIKVRSHYERRLADFLTDSGIEFIYEPLMLIAGRQYRPDFYLPQHNLFIELCGYNHMPFYVDRVAQKRELYRKHNLKAIFVNYNGRGSLERMVTDELKGVGVDLED